MLKRSAFEGCGRKREGGDLKVNCVPLIRGVVGFHNQAEHFVERHGLVIILALGESIVAMGSAATGPALARMRSGVRIPSGLGRVSSKRLGG